MNDFMKHELIDLLNLCNTLMPDTGLQRKIQSLIDNYCEHEYRHSNEAHFKCINCGGREK